MVGTGGIPQRSTIGDPLRIDELKQRAERTRRGNRMGLLALTTAYVKKDWNEVGRLVQHLELTGYLR